MCEHELLNTERRAELSRYRLGLGSFREATSEKCTSASCGRDTRQKICYKEMLKAQVLQEVQLLYDGAALSIESCTGLHAV